MRPGTGSPPNLVPAAASWEAYRHSAAANAPGWARGCPRGRWSPWCSPAPLQLPGSQARPGLSVLAPGAQLRCCHLLEGGLPASQHLRWLAAWGGGRDRRGPQRPAQAFLLQHAAQRHAGGQTAGCGYPGLQKDNHKDWIKCCHLQPRLLCPVVGSGLLAIAVGDGQGGGWGDGQAPRPQWYRMPPPPLCQSHHRDPSLPLTD